MSDESELPRPNPSEAGDPGSRQPEGGGPGDPSPPESPQPVPQQPVPPQPAHPAPWPQPPVGAAGPVGDTRHVDPLPAYGGIFGLRLPEERPAPQTRLSGRLWAAIAVLSLGTGVAGGAIGYSLQETLGRDGLKASAVRTVAPLAEGNQSVAAVAGELLPSTVQVLAGDGTGAGTGSGFVLDAQGHVITNNHVVASATGRDEISVVDSRGETYPATIVGRSTVYDLAVLDLGAGADLPPAALGASKDLLVGDQVVAFGAPLGLTQTVTAGIVSALDRPVTTGSSSDASSFINAVQTDAAINPGNSGGPLVDLRGRVVGVNSAIATTGGLLGESGNIGVGFAIPVEQVVVTVDQILRTGQALYPVIGATVDTGENGAVGARIEEVREDGPADRAGLEDGDLVTRVGDVRVTSGTQLIVQIRTHQPGDVIELQVGRGGDARTVRVTLGSEVG